MCGLVGVVGGDTERDLIYGLSMLQYRGYDSYGLCTAHENNLSVRKELSHIDTSVSFDLKGTLGIAHTRWATHGKVTLANTHPIFSNHIAVVQNGVIENYREIKKLFPEFNWQGETDTECVVPLFLNNNRISVEFLQRTMQNLDGSYAILVLNSLTEEIYFLKKGICPLIIGIKEGQKVIASDIKIFTGFETIIEVQDMQCGILSHDKLVIYPEKMVYAEAIDDQVKTTKSEGTWFESEFKDQPKILKAAFNKEIEFPPFRPSEVTFTGCGSAFLAGRVGTYWMRNIANIPSHAVLSSEMPGMSQCVVGISQSGETADTLQALRSTDATYKVGIINNEYSTMRGYVDYTIPTLAREEFSVASTKATTGQMLAILRWACFLGQQDMSEEISSMIDLMHLFIEKHLDRLEPIADLAATKSNLFILGRGILYPIAREAALKVKELAYIHAEGMQTAELKHGPLAVIDENSLVICLSPGLDHAVAEIEARKGTVVVFTAEPESYPTSIPFQMPEVPHLLLPFIYLLPLQWLAYLLAIRKGNNVDMPRNLAKSVTVF
jgi:glutamine---fructose-6-phosphate transaminase (isomerizing)